MHPSFYNPFIVIHHLPYVPTVTTVAGHGFILSNNSCLPFASPNSLAVSAPTISDVGLEVNYRFKYNYPKSFHYISFCKQF